MRTKNILLQVRDFADQAHGIQKRKYTPDRYIVHPIRVMEILKNYTSEIPVLAAALLHDVLEDTPVKKDELMHFLLTIMSEPESKKTLALVEELSDIYTKKAYPAYNRRKRKSLELGRMQKISPEAQTIKYADIIDNCQEIVQHDPDFARVFLNECKALLKKIQDGNPELYKIAMENVDRNLSLSRR